MSSTAITCPDEPDHSPEGRAAMRALTETGRYEETPDSYDWLWREATNVAALVRDYPDVTEAEARAHFLLCDTALYDLTQHEDRQAIGSDVSAIVAAVRAVLNGSPSAGGET